MVKSIIVGKDFNQEWTQKLMNDDSFTDSIPSVKADFVALISGKSRL